MSYKVEKMHFLLGTKIMQDFLKWGVWGDAPKPVPAGSPHIPFSVVSVSRKLSQTDCLKTESHLT